VDNEVGQRKILGRIKDGEDHMIFLVDGSKFKNTMAADYDPDTYVLPTVGEKVFLFGDGAAIWPPQYRTGYYMGSTQVDDSTGADASTDTTLLLLDLNIIPGDSGSAIYGSDGKLVSLVTYGVGGKFCGSYKMAFTWGQIVQAESF
jgi:hypothetical protein